MNKRNLRIRSIESDKDIKSITSILVESFRGPDVKAWFRMSLESHHFRPEHTRLAEIDNRIVSFVMFVPWEWRIGSSILNGGCFVNACTKAEYRERGFYLIIFRDLLQFLQHNGYHLAMGYARIKPYSRFGFAPCFYRSMISITSKKVKDENRLYLVRRCEEKDIKIVAELYDFYVQKRTSCSSIRPIEFWKTTIQYHPHREGLLVVEDNKTRRIVGYVWIKPPHNDMFWVDEVEVVDDDVSQTILAYCIRDAKRLNLRKIYFPIPSNHPFGKFCLSLGAQGSVEAIKPEGYRSGNEDIALLLNPISALRTMVPEFESLILNSNYKDWKGKVSFAIDKERIDLFIERGRVKISCGDCKQDNTVKIPRIRLVQLIFGCKDIYEIKHYPGVFIKPQFLDVLSVIFPKRYPQAPTWDSEFPVSRDNGIFSIAKKYFTLTSRQILKLSKKVFK